MVGATLVVVDVGEVLEVLALGHDLLALVIVPPVRLLPSRSDDEAAVLVVAW